MSNASDSRKRDSQPQPSGPDRQPDQPARSASGPLPVGTVVRWFVLPGVLVGSAVLVFLFFGLAVSEPVAWPELVPQLDSGQARLRWQAVRRLSELLAESARSGNRDGLLTDRQLALALSGRLKRAVERGGWTEDDARWQAALAQLLGQLWTPEVVLPALLEVASVSKDRLVRRHALASVAAVLGRAEQAGRDDPAVSPPSADWQKRAVASLTGLSGDPDPLVRQLVAYCLGLCEDDQADEPLQRLLRDGDRSTRLNAAVALARRGSPTGAEVLLAALEQSAASGPTGSKRSARRVQARPGERRPDALAGQAGSVDRRLVLRNALKALRAVAAELTPEQRRRAERVAQQLAHDADASVRVEALRLRESLERLRTDVAKRAGSARQAGAPVESRREDSKSSRSLQ